jgi:hypothetical protein
MAAAAALLTELTCMAQVGGKVRTGGHAGKNKEKRYKTKLAGGISRKTVASAAKIKLRAQANSYGGYLAIHKRFHYLPNV